MKWFIILHHFVEYILGEMCPSVNGTRSVRPGGKYCSIRHTKISEILSGIVSRIEHTPVENSVPFIPRIFRKFTPEVLVKWKVPQFCSITAIYILNSIEKCASQNLSPFPGPGRGVRGSQNPYPFYDQNG